MDYADGFMDGFKSEKVGVGVEVFGLNAKVNISINLDTMATIFQVKMVAIKLVVRQLITFLIANKAIDYILG